MTTEWSDLVADEARQCARCGQRTAFAARMPKVLTVGQERSVAVADAGAVWFCFECGHEEREEPRVTFRES